MSDVFISYAREDSEAAQALAQALESRGLTVWWDRVIPPGRQFDEVIEEQLEVARCVVVLWSTASASSKWVKAEAGEALQLDKLVPALMSTGVRLPLEFRRVQAADLSTWQPGLPSPALDEFCTAVATAVAAASRTMRTHSRARKAAAKAPAPPVPPPAPPPPASARSRQTWAWVAAGVVGVLVLAAVLGEWDDPAPLPSPVPGPLPAPQPVTTQGLDTALRWRDYLFAYQGRLQWDGRSTIGSVELRALDSGSGLITAQGRFDALLLPNTGDWRVFYVKVPVPMGDSRTVGPHFHDNNLVFERAPGGAWVFVRNCMQLTRPDSCFQ